MKRWLIAILILTASVSAQKKDDNKVSTGDPKTDEMMVEIQKSGKKSDVCMTRQTTLIRIMGQELELEANAAFKRPNLMRINTVQDKVIMSQRVSDGGLMWTYDRTEKIAAKVNMGRVYRITGLEADADQPDPLRPFRALEWTSIRYTGDEIFEGTSHRVFSATPKPSLLHAQLPEPPVKIHLIINPKDGLLRITRLLDADDNPIITQTFHDLTVNPDLKDKWFEFIIPSGAHIIDSTGDTIEALKAVEPNSK